MSQDGGAGVNGCLLERTEREIWVRGSPHTRARGAQAWARSCTSFEPGMNGCWSGWAFAGERRAIPMARLSYTSQSKGVGRSVPSQV